MGSEREAQGTPPARTESTEHARRAPAGVPAATPVAQVLALQRTAGNAAVARALARAGSLNIARTPATDVHDALQEKSRWSIGADDGDTKKAWGVLNHQNMASMLAAMETLRNTGELDILLRHQGDASKYNVPRLMLGVHVVQLRAAGPIEPAGLAKLAPELPAAGDQVPDIEAFLRLPPSGLTDPQAGAGTPDAAAQGKIAAALSPGGGAVMGPWDGDGASATAAANRAKLKTDLLAALAAHLKREMPRIRKLVKAPKLPMTSFEGAGRQAKRLVDGRFGALTSGAVLTSSQEAGRASFNFTAHVNLLDETDPADYTPDPTDITSWIAETDKAASAVQSAHSFDKSRGPEKAFLTNEIIAPFVKAGSNEADLKLYDAYGFATADSGKVWATPQLTGNTKAPAKGVPSPAERQARWAMWETLAHEYLHTLEHPAFSDATRGRRVMKEGFCELFTKEVLTAAIPGAQADSDPALRVGVEGSQPDGSPFPGFTKSFVPDYHPGDYASYLANAEKIRDATSPAAVKAAFFQGHVELIGLSPDGKMAGVGAPATEVKVPPGVTSLFALGVITNTSVDAIVAANTGLAPSSAVPATLQVPGCRYHTVVEATERRPTGGVMSSKAESPKQIAAMHGITEDQLKRANPQVTDWSKVAGGDRVLIPAH